MVWVCLHSFILYVYFWFAVFMHVYIYIYVCVDHTKKAVRKKKLSMQKPRYACIYALTHQFLLVSPSPAVYIRAHIEVAIYFGVATLTRERERERERARFGI